MFQEIIGPVEGEKRSVQHRSRVMLAATILTRGMSVDVRIRDLSRSGALVEGNKVPEAGTTIELLRNSQAARAEVVWSKRGRCGLKFENQIVIEEWVGSVAKSPTTPSPAYRDDGSRPSASLPGWLNSENPPVDLEDQLPMRVGEEMAYVQRLIESVGRDLQSSPVVRQRHAGSVQSCRAASALLGELARVLLAKNRLKAAEAIAAAELRTRLLR
jgi:hypothetical protein